MTLKHLFYGSCLQEHPAISCQILPPGAPQSVRLAGASSALTDVGKRRGPPQATGLVSFYSSRRLTSRDSHATGLLGRLVRGRFIAFGGGSFLFLDGSSRRLVSRRLASGGQLNHRRFQTDLAQDQVHGEAHDE